MSLAFDSLTVEGLAGLAAESFAVSVSGVPVGWVVRHPGSPVVDGWTAIGLDGLVAGRGFSRKQDAAAAFGPPPPEVPR